MAASRTASLSEEEQQALRARIAERSGKRASARPKAPSVAPVELVADAAEELPLFHPLSRYRRQNRFAPGVQLKTKNISV